MKLKHILIYSILIFASTFVVFKFSKHRLSDSLPQSSNNVSQSFSSAVFKVQSKFNKYSVTTNSIDRQLLSNITHDLKLDTDGYCQLGTHDLVHPDTVKFIFADINSLPEQEKKICQASV